jgi:hypothetical protein
VVDVLGLGARPGVPDPVAGLPPWLDPAVLLCPALAGLVRRTDAPLVCAGWVGRAGVADGVAVAAGPGTEEAGGVVGAWSAAGASCGNPAASSQTTPAPARTVAPAASAAERRRPGREDGVGRP